MRRVLLVMIVFSLCLMGCTSTAIKETKPMAERNQISFVEWSIPGYFIPRQVYLIGLGDSLTQGVGDELKKGGYFGRISDTMQDWRGISKLEYDNMAKKGRRSDQLIEQLEQDEIQSELKKADIIFITIGGNDLMKIVKANLFNLKVNPFYVELGKFEDRLDEIFTLIRSANSDAVIVASGLYNPFSIVTEESNEFDSIIEDWNEAIQIRAVLDGRSCFVPVIDLFDSNVNMVYHTDFFHPNAKGYVKMADRFLEELEKCGYVNRSDGELDM